MKKQWIAEALYIVVAAVFIGICIRYGNAGEQEVFGTNITGVPTGEPGQMLQEGTGEPGQVTPAETGSSDATTTPTPDTSSTPNLNGAADTAATSAPVQDTIPDEVPGQASGEISTTIPEQSGSYTPTPAILPEPTLAPTGTVAVHTPGMLPNGIEIKNENYEQYDNEEFSWWFRRNETHQPSGSGEHFPIEQYSAYYLDKTATEEDKVFYITFDCGYENGFTPTILDTLKEKDVKAIFFVTKDFIVKNPEYVKRMKEEGHLVGNHTVRHLSSPTLSPEELAAELYEVAVTMEELTGYSIDPFFRTPMGDYSQRVLKVVQDMGYTSAFWSIAYYDYDVNNQPGKDYVVDHFATYHHNGCIALIHNISESNTQALGDVLDLLRKAGYRFGSLDELRNKN